ncbi:MAG: ADOP family duplicated permease [Gemmatimonadaceae bacterium]
MSWLRGTWMSARALLRRRAVERELDEELRFHIDREIEERIARGMSPERARASAMRDFGGVERFKEECRDERGVRWLDDLSQDLHFALRSLRSRPGFAALVILTLGFGIGATTAIFSVVNSVLLRPLAYRDPDRLVMVWETDRDSGTEREGASVPDYFDFVQRNAVFERIAAFETQPMSLTTADGDPERLDAARVTSNLLPTLGVSPVLGRGIDAAEDVPGGERTVVISEELWHTRFGSRADVLGQVLNLDEQPYTIVGVVPAGLDVPQEGTDIWVPLQYAATSSPRSRHNVVLVARLEPGVTLAAAQENMSRIATQLEAEYPADNDARGVMLEPLPDALLSSVRPAMALLLGAVALVLLIACVNAANLLLARMAARRREVAVRRALGASAGRLVRQFFTESLVLTLAAAVVGVAAATFGLRALLRLAPPNLPRVSQIALDPTVLTVTLAVSVAVAMVFGLMPAMGAKRVHVQSSLKNAPTRGGSAGPSQQRLRGLLVTSEMALAVMLVIGAGLLVRSFVRLKGVDPGFRADNVLKAQFQLPETRYPRDFAVYPNWPEIQGFHSEVMSRIGARPGVRSVAIAGSHPIDSGFTNSFVIEGREDEAADQPEMATRIVSAGYFGTMDLRLLRGRGFEERDDARSPLVVVINEAAAKRFFPSDTPIGHRLRFWGSAMRDIVGVVENERFHGLGQHAPPAMYAPLAQAPMWTGSILVRTAGDPGSLLDSIVSDVRQVDPSLAIFGAERLSDTLDRTLARQRFTMLLLGIFAAVAIVLAVVGVHGVLSYAVAQRTQEIGIRTALGASSGQIVRLVVGQGLTLAAAGVALGLLGALALSRLLAGMLYGVATTDVLTYSLVAAATLLVAAAASYLPAYRATRVSPVVALRSE